MHLTNWISIFFQTIFVWIELKHWILIYRTYNPYHVMIFNYIDFMHIITKSTLSQMPFYPYATRYPINKFLEMTVWLMDFYVVYVERPFFYLCNIWLKVDFILSDRIPFIWMNIKMLFNFYIEHYIDLVTQIIYYVAVLYEYLRQIVIEVYSYVIEVAKQQISYYWNLIFIETLPKYIHHRESLIFYLVMAKNVEFAVTKSYFTDQIYVAWPKFCKPYWYFSDTIKFIPHYVMLLIEDYTGQKGFFHRLFIEQLFMAALCHLRVCTDPWIDALSLRLRIPRSLFDHSTYYAYDFFYNSTRYKPTFLRQSHEVKLLPQDWNSELFGYWTHFKMAHKFEGRLHATGDFHRFMEKHWLIGHWIRKQYFDVAYHIEGLDGDPVNFDGVPVTPERPVELMRLLLYGRITSTLDRYLPLCYFVILTVFLTISKSFRALMMPRVFEGTSQIYWNKFRKEMDEDWWNELLLIPNVCYQVGEGVTQADSNYLLGDEAYGMLSLSQFRKDKNFENFDEKDYGETPSDYVAERKEMDRLEKEVDKAKLLKHVLLAAETQEFAAYRRRDISASLDLLFLKNPFLRATYFKKQRSEVKGFSDQWRSLLAPGDKKIEKNDQLYGDFVSHYYDLKGLYAYESLRYVSDSLPERTERLLTTVNKYSFNLIASLELFNASYDEEIRADHLYQPWVLENSVKFVDNVRTFFSYIDEKVFDNRLNELFFHKDYQSFYVTKENISYLMQRPLLRATPLLQQRARAKEPHYAYYPEDSNLCVAWGVWYVMLPALVFVQSVLYHEGLLLATTIKTERIITEYWWNFQLTWVSQLESFNYIKIYLLNIIGVLEMPMRAGSVGALEPPETIMLEALVKANYFYTAQFYQPNTYGLTGLYIFIDRGNFSLYPTEMALLSSMFKIYYFFLIFYLVVMVMKRRKILIEIKKIKNFRVKYLTRSSLANLIYYDKIKETFGKGLLYFWL